MILETERLFLREMRQNDFRDLAEILQNPNEMIGQAGLTIQPYKNAEVLEIGYLLKERFWHCGYAREAVNGCKKYAFEYLNKDKVYSIIKADNLASIKVAESVGMSKEDEFITQYEGVKISVSMGKNLL